MLMISPIGMINRPTVVPIAIAAAAGHPTSTVVSDKWNLGEYPKVCVNLQTDVR